MRYSLLILLLAVAIAWGQAPELMTRVYRVQVSDLAVEDWGRDPIERLKQEQAWIEKHLQSRQAGETWFDLSSLLSERGLGPVPHGFVVWDRSTHQLVARLPENQCRVLDDLFREWKKKEPVHFRIEAHILTCSRTPPVEEILTKPPKLRDLFSGAYGEPTHIVSGTLACQTGHRAKVELEATGPFRFLQLDAEPQVSSDGGHVSLNLLFTLQLVEDLTFEQWSSTLLEFGEPKLICLGGVGTAQSPACFLVLTARPD